MFSSNRNNILSVSPVQAAVSILVVALLLALMQGPPSLQNDDYQIFFLLCGGGTEPCPFSIYGNSLFGCLLSFLSSFAPRLNCYLVFLFFAAVLGCLYLNMTVMERLLGHGRIAVLLASSFLLIYINVECLSCIQYTHIAVLCVCSGMLQIDRVIDGGVLWKRSLVATVLVTIGFCLRQQTAAPAVIFLIGVLSSHLVVIPQRMRNLRRAILALLPVVGVCSTLYVFDNSFYKNHPEWEHSLTFSNLRVGIQDSRDNSGLDKSALLEQAGISPSAFRRFRSFVYTPQFESLDFVKKGVEIHRTGRKGLLGLDAAQKLGLLELDTAHVFPRTTIPRTVTPFVPLAVSLFLLIFYGGREQILRGGVVMVALVFYLLVLALMSRMVGRVLNPYLYVVSLHLCSLSFCEQQGTSRCRMVSYASIAIAFVAVVFCFRHYNPSPGRWWKKTAHPSAEYCSQHSDTLFFTCCMQGCGLYPTGFSGYTYDYLRKTNVLPVADGWIFYTPAYKAALRARGIDNPYQRMLEPNVELITFTRKSSEWMLRNMQDEIFCQTGTRVSFELAAKVPNYAFWRIIPKTEQ